MKVQPRTRCYCTICTRSRTCLCSICERDRRRVDQVEHKPSEVVEVVECDDDPVPSTSKLRSSSSPATLLPFELQSQIFRLASNLSQRSSTIPSSIVRVSTPSTPQLAFARLSTVCRAWTATARRELVRIVTIHSVRQLGKIIDAFSTPAFDPERVQVIFLAVDILREEFLPMDQLRKLYHLCTRVTTIRVVGFGERAMLKPERFRAEERGVGTEERAVPKPENFIMEESEAPLHGLKTFEYSPVDSAAPISVSSLSSYLHHIPSLTSLKISPRRWTPIRSPKHDSTHLLPRACLTRLDLSMVKIDAAQLTRMLASSTTSLRSISFADCDLGNPSPLVTFFETTGPHLTKLKIATHSGLPFQSTGSVWKLVKSCPNLQELVLFGDIISSPSASTYILPRSLKMLAIGKEDFVTGPGGDIDDYIESIRRARSEGRTDSIILFVMSPVAIPMSSEMEGIEGVDMRFVPVGSLRTLDVLEATRIFRMAIIKSVDKEEEEEEAMSE